MKRFSLLFAAVSLLLSTGCAERNFENSQLSSQDLNGIIGGVEVQSSEDMAKTIVALYDVTGGYLCTGSIYKDNLIITAAHCVGEDPSTLRVIFGTNVLDKDKIVARNVVAAAVNSLWETRQGEMLDTGDIAVVKFDGALPEGYKAAKLMVDPTVLKAGGTVTLAGYGLSDGVAKEGSGLLRKVDVQIEEPAISKTEVLINQKNGKAACHGDSGGPAYALVNGELHLWGVTSRTAGDEKDHCNAFAIYTSVVVYTQWLGKAEEALKNGQGSVPTELRRVAGQ